MTERLLFAAALLGACLLPLPAQTAPEAAAPEAAAPEAVLDDATVAAIRREGLENSHVMRWLDHLTNTIGHRLTGSRNFDLAAEWAKREFERMGLAVELEEWGSWPIGWDRGQWQGRVVAPVAMDLQVATEAWTAPTRGRVRAPLLRAPANDIELERLAARIPGAYLLESPDPEGRFTRFAGLEELIAAQPIAGWVRASRGSDEYPDRIRVFGRPPRDPDMLPRIPEIVVRADQAAEIEKLLDAGQEVVVEFDLRNRWREGPVALHNVIAELRGVEKPEEVVVVCGHLDSWHQATGTTDNGTGVATTLEAARILSAIGARPKRTIRFCLWGGEEQGLLGSRGHVLRRRAAMGDVSIVLNHDTGTNWAQHLTVNAANLEALQRVAVPVLGLTPPDADFDGPVFELRARERITGGGGSDHASFLSARVPAFPWGLVGRVDYSGYTWHSQWDTFDVAVPEYQRHTSTVIALFALGVADLPEKLSNDGIEPQAERRALPIEDLMGRRFAAKFGGEGALVVREIEPEGRAARIGLVDGDRIVALDGEPLATLADLRLGLRGIGDQDTVKITVERNGESTELTVDAAELRARRRPRR